MKLYIVSITDGIDIYVVATSYGNAETLFRERRGYNDDISGIREVADTRNKTLCHDRVEND